MNSIDENDEKPTVLRKPRSLLRFLTLLLALFILIYMAVAAMAFFRNQSEAPSVPASAPASQEEPNV